MTPYIQVVSTLPDQQTAEQLTASLLELRLAACVQMSPVTSWFHWKNAIEKEDEVVCTMKSHRALFPELEEIITKMHPYEVPEILATPVVAASTAYLNWLKKELKEVEENH